MRKVSDIGLKPLRAQETFLLALCDEYIRDNIRIAEMKNPWSNRFRLGIASDRQLCLLANCLKRPSVGTQQKIRPSADEVLS